MSQLHRRLMSLALGILLLLAVVVPAEEARAQLQRHPAGEGEPSVLRSLESLRDLDYQAWQLVAWREEIGRAHV